MGGCGNDEPACEASKPDSCSDGQVCEDVGGTATCVKPVVLRGHVKSSTGAPIADARVAAVDGTDAPATGTAVSAADGSYELRVPVARASADAVPQMKIKLRAAADQFETFPLGLRPSLPIELSAAVAQSDAFVLESAQTEIVLYPLAATGLNGSIAGTVQNGVGQSGALIVAQGTSTVTAVSDRDGAYVLFNVPVGTYTVSAYAAGLSVEPRAGVVVAASARTEPVDFTPSSASLGTVSGSVNIVNPGMGSATSVVLVVDATFNDVLKRGEVPPGLRAPKTGAPSITNAFSIEGVPAGRYVVLAAFENDFLVRDPDTSISGTAIQRVTVAGAPVAVPASFKITGSLDVISPGAGDVPDVVNGTPTFKWKDDSSEDFYTLEVFDTHGTMVWNKLDVPRVTGGDVSVVYGGPALAPGFYQFRATSVRNKGGAGGTTPISQTEDLRGIFEAR